MCQPGAFQQCAQEPQDFCSPRVPLQTFEWRKKESYQQEAPLVNSSQW